MIHVDSKHKREQVGLAGVHWTSGDVDPREDALPLRELAGGYSGLGDPTPTRPYTCTPTCPHAHRPNIHCPVHIQHTHTYTPPDTH